VDRKQQHRQSWARQLDEGNPQVAAEFWEQYGERLRQLADRHLATHLQRRFEPEDVVQSACRTFFRRVQRGEFQQCDRDNLWRLMCAITLAKVRQKARFHGRQKRSPGAEQYIDATAEDDRGASEVACPEPTPEEVVGFADQLELLLKGMDSEEQELVQLKLQNYSNQEIADQMGCSERTVRRLVKRVKSQLVRSLEESSAA
jgi:RNA polymerase sigma factor (sigma-70 family)